MGRSPLGIPRPGDVHPGDALGQLRQQTVAQGPVASDPLLLLGQGQLQRFGHPHYAGHVLGASAAVALLGAAQLLRQQGRSRTDVERAHALGAVELVGADGHHIYAQAVHVQVEDAHRLHGIGVEDGAGVARLDDACRFGHGLDGPYLVVDVHDGHQHGIRPHRPLEGLQVDESLSVDRQIGDAEALLLQALGGMEHSVMLDGRHDDMVAPLPHGLGHTAQGQVVGLGSARGEDDLLGPAAQGLGHGAPGPLQPLARLLRLQVHAGGVPPVLGEVREHGFQHAGVQGRGGGVVEIGPPHILHHLAP
ncbi:hypothetical protein HRbin24_00471 [bacterium HR24]|nr:hypothetical protein HRbin24_00471 [bacterium HR24]